MSFPPALLTASCSTTKFDLSQEEPPLPFRVEYFWSSGGKTFDRIAFYNQMLENFVSLVDTAWNETMDAIQFPTAFGIQMRFLSDRMGAGMKVKHIVWALEEVFDIFVENNRYATGTVIVNSNWWEDRLAIGSIGLGTSSTLEINNTVETSMSMLESPGDKQLSMSNVTQALNENERVDSITNLTDMRVSLDLEYREGGASISAVQFYNATLKMMIKNAEVSRKSLPLWPTLSVYNDMDNFTLSLRPISFQKRTLLSYRKATFIMCYLPIDMMRYGEMSGLVKVGGKPTGVLCLDAGDRTTQAVGNLCQAPRLSETASGNEGVATS